MKTKPFTRDEIRKIRKVLKNRIDGKRDLAMFNVQVDTMLRTSDLRRLKVSDVRYKENQAIKDQFSLTMEKTGRTVSCVLDVEAQGSLQEWIAESGKDSKDYLLSLIHI